MALDCDVILFKSPPFECCLFVTNIPVDTHEEQLLEAFGQWGLINDLHKFNTDTLKRKADSVTTCVSVRYYTKTAAKQAMYELNGRSFGGMPCKISYAKQLRETNQNLPFPKSVELCNYYLGFNKWSSKIVAVHKVACEKVGEDSISCEFACEIMISLSGGRSVNGIGCGKFTGKYIPRVFEVARKTSITDARKNAFSKLTLIVLTSGKVDVHILGQQKVEKKKDEEEEKSFEDILKILHVPVLPPDLAKR